MTKETYLIHICSNLGRNLCVILSNPHFPRDNAHLLIPDTNYSRTSVTLQTPLGRGLAHCKGCFNVKRPVTKKNTADTLPSAFGRMQCMRSTWVPNCGAM